MSVLPILSTGLSRYEKKAEKVLDDQHKMSLPAFRSQINHILMTEKKTDFVGYMNELHKVGEAAYKRSSIPNENMIEAAQELKGIKRVRWSLLLLLLLLFLLFLLLFCSQ